MLLTYWGLLRLSIDFRRGGLWKLRARWKWRTLRPPGKRCPPGQHRRRIRRFTRNSSSTGRHLDSEPCLGEGIVQLLGANCLPCLPQPIREEYGRTRGWEPLGVLRRSNRCTIPPRQLLLSSFLLRQRSNASRALSRGGKERPFGRNSVTTAVPD